jgi:uncharacterized membrane protein YqjE
MTNDLNGVFLTAAVEKRRVYQTQALLVLGLGKKFACFCLKTLILLVVLIANILPNDHCFLYSIGEQACCGNTQSE